MPYPNPNALRFPSTETYSAATTADITVTATLAPRRWTADIPQPRRWTAELEAQS